MPVYNRLVILLSDKQSNENRIISIKDLSDETGISRQTLHKWLRNEMDQFRSETIEVLCKYFDCTLGELLYIEDDESQSK